MQFLHARPLPSGAALVLVDAAHGSPYNGTPTNIRRLALVPAGATYRNARSPGVKILASKVYTPSRPTSAANADVWAVTALAEALNTHGGSA